MSSNDEEADQYVRIPRTLLATVQINHLISEIDLSIAIPKGMVDLPAPDVITGYTEWVGTWQSSEISIGWDWGVVRGLIVLLAAAEIRTNVQLTEDGRDLPPMLNRIHLFAWIETLPWRDVGIPPLLDKTQT